MTGKLSIVALIARRFLFSRASGGFLSFVSVISMTGVTLGVLALVSVMSVINGFEGELVRSVTGVHGEVILYSKGVPLQDPEEIMKKIREVAPAVAEVTPSFISELMIAGPHGAAGVVAEGMDFESARKVVEIEKRLVSGAMPESDDEIVLGKALSEKIGAMPGTTVRMIAPFSKSESPRTRQVKVSGIVNLGYYDYDSKYVFGTLRGMQEFLEEPGKVTSFKLKLKDRDLAEATALRLEDHFGYPYRAKEWARLNRNLLYAIKVEKAVIGVIMTMIIVVAAFNVVSSLLMMIHDKVKEISILKAMGFRRRQSFQLFLWIGLGIGMAGTALGLILGYGMNRFIERAGLIDLPADVYHLGKFPVQEKVFELMLIAVVAVLITGIAALYPAIQVSRRSPIEGIRYE